MEHAAADPGRIAVLAQAIAEGEVSARDTLERYLDRIDAVDTSVQAWCAVDRAGARQRADDVDTAIASGARLGPLAGIPLAVKDVIDVAGFATRNGSRSCADAPPAHLDAAVVGHLRAAGAIVVGKVHTTEFAFFEPSPARNPHNLGHTPGGSSSGSAAAVAAGTIPGALGTQTVASVNRPAAYCGVAAFKPSTGLLSTAGVTPLSSLYDTVGFFGATVSDAVALFRAASPAYVGGLVGRDRVDRQPAPATLGDGEHPYRVIRFDDPLLSVQSAEVADALDATEGKLRARGVCVELLRSPVDFEEVRKAQWTTCLYEIGRIHSSLVGNDQVGEKLRGAIADGLNISEAAYFAARAALARHREAVYGACQGAVVLWPAAPTTAPAGLSSTGDPRFVAPWTGLGGPVVTFPAGVSSSGLPIGLLLAGHPGSDDAFASVAQILTSDVDGDPG